MDIDEMISIAVDTPIGRGILLQFIQDGNNNTKGVVLVGLDFHAFLIDDLKFVDWR